MLSKKVATEPVSTVNKMMGFEQVDMAHLVDIVEIAESLETKSIHVVEDRCVVVRNRNVRCRKCQEACPVDAFAIAGNTLSLNHSACVSCGACSTVCPTETLIPLRPLDDELANATAEATLNNGGISVFACARIASKQLADPDTFAEVPCLARLEENILCGLAARGIEEILLIDGECASCKYHVCNAGIDETVASANTLIGAVGSDSRVVRRSSFPDRMLVEEASELYGVSRRDFFSQTKGGAKAVAEKTASALLKSQLQERVATLKERLGISEAGTIPHFEPERRMRILDSLDSIGTPAVDEIDTRLWGKVHIDTAECNACHMCTVFCPTGALEKVEFDGGTTGIEFLLSACVQCRTCEDICLKKCLTVDTVVPLDELFDFEPRLTVLPPQVQTGLPRNRMSR